MFKKGESGNPSGRPKVVAEVRELAREHTVMAVATLVEIAKGRKVDPRARVAACNALLDRGFGKPAQEVALKGENLPTAIIMQVIGPKRP